MSTLAPQRISEKELIGLFYEVEVEMEAASKRRFQPTDTKVLRDSMKAMATAHARLRQVIDMTHAAGYDARTLMDAAHMQFIECTEVE